MSDHVQNIKAALAVLGPKVVLELVRKDMEQRSSDACNKEAEAMWTDAAYRLEKIIQKQ